MRIAIVGAGFWTPFQLHGWREVPGVEFAAIASRSCHKAEAIASEFGIPKVFADVEEMLAWGEFDAVDIVSSVEAHYEHVRLSAEAGKTVICQKPIAENLDRATEMVELCQRHGVRLLINENWRFQRPLRMAQDLLRKGAIGEPFRARVQFSTSFPVYDNQPALAKAENFILSDVGTHLFDTVRSFFGEPISLYAQTSRVADIKGEDVASVRLRMTGCPVVNVELSYATAWSEDRFPETYLLIEGKLGSIEVRPGCEIRLTTPQGTQTISAEPLTYPWMDPAYAVVHSSIVDCQLHLAESLRSGSMCEVEGSENLKSLSMVFASYESADEDRIIRFEEEL